VEWGKMILGIIYSFGLNPTLLQAKEIVTVLSVAGGDTLIVSYQGKEESIKFTEIDAPESK
jgi:endonuclease YncB( thermonuclease family)